MTPALGKVARFLSRIRNCLYLAHKEYIIYLDFIHKSVALRHTRSEHE
jgi:hypothetical protein